MKKSEQEIINDAYYLIEVDSEPWNETDDEYLTARGLANIAIDRWEKYENTTWDELIVPYTDNADGSHSYDCPENFIRPVSFVRINGELYDVVKPQRLQELANSGDKFVYFTGNPKLGYKLNINKNLTVKDGLIEYEYYQSSSKLNSPADTTEMADPYFISYFIAAHMGDEGINTDYYQMAEARLEQMKTVNSSGLFGIADNILFTADMDSGFGQ